MICSDVKKEVCVWGWAIYRYCDETRYRSFCIFCNIVIWHIMSSPCFKFFTTVKQCFPNYGSGPNLGRGPEDGGSPIGRHDSLPYVFFVSLGPKERQNLSFGSQD